MTESRRFQISALLERGISVSEIAKTAECHSSTVYRELKRASKGSHSQVLSIKKHTPARKCRISQERVDFISFLLEADWSPKQLSSVLTKVGAAVSHEWISRFVAQDKRLGGNLYRHLRQGHKRYRRGRKEKAPMIKNAVSIDDRSSIAGSKERLGNRHGIRQTWYWYYGDNFRT